MINQDLINRFYVLRKLMGVPLRINSGYRCQKHNDKVGGVADSFHKRGGSAIDISNTGLSGQDILKLKRLAADIFDYTKEYSTFIHCHVEEA